MNMAHLALGTAPVEALRPVIKQAALVSHWSTEGVNAIDPELYKRYLAGLYGLTGALAEHPFLDAMASSLSYTPFSPEKALHVMREHEAGISVKRVEIDISDACSFHCAGCTFKFRSSDQMIPWSGMLEIVPALKRNGIRAITLVGGGDPTRYQSEGRRLPDVTELLHSHGIDCFVVTNAFDLTDDVDVERILSTVKGLRVSYYETINKGEPENKNTIVKQNIERMLRVRSRIGSETMFNIGNLVAFNKPENFARSLQLAREFGIVVTPRPFIVVERNAKMEVAPETTDRILTTTLRNYETIAPHIGEHAPIAAREFLERILVFNLPFERTCPMTERGLVGKLRANGDLYRCGQLSTVQPRKRQAAGLTDEILYRNVLENTGDGVATNFEGYPALPSFSSCPTCRESLNNARFLRFAGLDADVREELVRVTDLAFGGGRNLATFW